MSLRRPWVVETFLQFDGNILMSCNSIQSVVRSLAIETTTSRKHTGLETLI